MTQTTPQQQFTEMLPAFIEQAEYRFREYPEEERNERVAEATAIAWRAFLRLLERGKKAYACPLAKFACRWVNVGRRVGSVRGTSITGILAKSRGVERVELADYLGARVDPMEQVDWRLDTEAWLVSLSPALRRTAEILIEAGPETRGYEIAKELGISPGRLSQRRLLLLESWNEFFTV